MVNPVLCSLSSEEALQRLMAGNARYLAFKREYPNQTPDRRTELTSGQNPVAVILGCSDSRVPPEIIFDQGLGDLFVVRLAGNILSRVALGSIEYAAAHLETSLVMVLGHSQCGAITAAAEGKPLEGNLPLVAAAIQPALEVARAEPGDLVTNAAKANSRLVAEQLMRSGPVLLGRINAGKLKIVGAYYDLETGAVQIIC